MNLKVLKLAGMKVDSLWNPIEHESCQLNYFSKSYNFYKSMDRSRKIQNGIRGQDFFFLTKDLH